MGQPRAAFIYANGGYPVDVYLAILERGGDTITEYLKNRISATGPSMWTKPETKSAVFAIIELLLLEKQLASRSNNTTLQQAALTRTRACLREIYHWALPIKTA